VASVDGKGLVQLDKVEDRQRIQELGNLVADLMVMIDSTIDTVTSLIEKYQILQPEEALDGVNSVLFTLREKQRHAVLIRKKAKALSGRVHGAAQLVSSQLPLYEKARLMLYLVIQLVGFGEWDCPQKSRRRSKSRRSNNAKFDRTSYPRLNFRQDSYDHSVDIPTGNRSLGESAG
jgi:hypothetical protein